MKLVYINVCNAEQTPIQMNTVVVPFNKEKVFLVNYASNGSAPDIEANDRITQIKAFFLDEFKVIFASQDIEEEKFKIVPTEDNRAM